MTPNSSSWMMRGTTSMIKDLQKIRIVNAILNKKEILPTLIGIHPELDEMIQGILQGTHQPTSSPRFKGLDTLIVTKEEINNDGGGAGLEIRFPGFKGNPQAPDDGQVFIEYYEDKIQVHVWNGEGDYPTRNAEDPVTVKIKEIK